MHLVSFLRGMAFGGFLVYLFAPRSGEETRQMLAQRGNDLKKLLADDMDELSGQAHTEANTIISSADDITATPVRGNIYNPANFKDM